MTPNANANYQYTSCGRIVVIGDLHGHYAGLVEVLDRAGLINEHLEWVGGGTTVVQMGDIFGRGTCGKSCAELLMSLEIQAAQAGGRVITLLGNHETLIAHRCFRYVPVEEMCHFSDLIGDDRNVQEVFREAMGPGGRIGAWIRSLPAAVIVDDYLFVHAGLEWSWAQFGLNWLNQRVLEAMADESEFRQLPATTPISSRTGPVWNRRFVSGEETPQLADNLQAALYDLQTAAMIVAHTPTLFIPGGVGGQIFRRFDGRLIAVDVGINPIYGGYCGWLEIENGRMVEKYAWQTELAATPGSRLS